MAFELQIEFTERARSTRQALDNLTFNTLQSIVPNIGDEIDLPTSQTNLTYFVVRRIISYPERDVQMVRLILDFAPPSLAPVT